MQIIWIDPCHIAFEFLLPNLFAVRGLDLCLRAWVGGDLFSFNAPEHHLAEGPKAVKCRDAGVAIGFQGGLEVLFNKIDIKVGHVLLGQCQTVKSKLVVQLFRWQRWLVKLLGL